MLRKDGKNRTALQFIQIDERLQEWDGMTVDERSLVRIAGLQGCQYSTIHFSSLVNIKYLIALDGTLLHVQLINVIIR